MILNKTALACFMLLNLGLCAGKTDSTQASWYWSAGLVSAKEVLHWDSAFYAPTLAKRADLFEWEVGIARRARLAKMFWISGDLCFWPHHPHLAAGGDLLLMSYGKPSFYAGIGLGNYLAPVIRTGSDKIDTSSILQSSFAGLESRARVGIASPENGVGKDRFYIELVYKNKNVYDYKDRQSKHYSVDMEAVELILGYNFNSFGESNQRDEAKK